MRPIVLQLGALTDATQATLEAGYDVRALPEDDAARGAWLAEHGPAVDAVVTTGHTGIAPALAEALPKLRLVAVNGVGYDRIDTHAMKARGIRVTNTPDVLTDDVADTAIGLMINAIRRLPAADRHVRDGHWPRIGSSALTRTASNKRYGILGLGRIGLAIARRLAGFGGTIAYAGPTRKAVEFTYFPDAVSLAAAVDVLFVANAASAATRNLVDAAVLEALGPDGVLVNVARGSIIDEPALVAALVDKRILAAGLDVFADEPHVPEALLTLENVALAPHVGSATAETREAMGRLMLDNLEAFFADKPLLTAVV